MSEQMGFPGFEPVPISLEQQKHAAHFHFFFAVYPDKDTAFSIATLAENLCREQGFSGGKRSAPLLHVTLHDLGDSPSDHMIARACRAADFMEKPSFNILFDRMLSFGGGAFVLCGKDEGVARLVAFRDDLGLAMKENGLFVKRSFTPHMTIAYNRRRIDEQQIEPILWKAERLVLVKSHLRQSFHETVEEWPFDS